jgi:hypothetical protein
MPSCQTDFILKVSAWITTPLMTRSISALSRARHHLLNKIRVRFSPFPSPLDLRDGTSTQVSSAEQDHRRLSTRILPETLFTIK